MKELSFDNEENYFVMSDLHGQGKLYDFVVNSLDETANDFKINLIIDGDVIDRGPESIRILIDIMNRVKHKKGKINVIMLAGNHEQMMYSALKYYADNGKWRKDDIWFYPDNHGLETARDFVRLPENIQNELYEFLESLPIFCRIKGKENETSYVIVHALAPTDALTAPKIPTLKDIETRENLQMLKLCLQYRESDEEINIPNISIQKDNVITIVGHTPVETEKGYEIKENGHLLMIDGGCCFMAQNPDSILLSEMLTVVRLSPNANELAFGTYGGRKEKEFRQSKTSIRKRKKLRQHKKVKEKTV